MRVLLDTSVLIGATAAGDFDEAAISAATLAELHFGALAAAEPAEPVERARRLQRLGAVEAAFEPLPLDERVAREWGSLVAAVAQRGGKPRRRVMDLVIAATANVAGVPLLTHDVSDLAIIDDLVDARTP